MPRPHVTPRPARDAAPPARNAAPVHLTGAPRPHVTLRPRSAISALRY
jgi:hypothetical protein